MKDMLLVLRLDLLGSLRSRWFMGYAAVFMIMTAMIFMSGVAEGRVMGFTGLTRGLLVFIQACNIIMPVFVLVTTVRTISGDRESNVLEYLLSFPVSLRSYYFGKFLGRFIVVSAPLILSMLLALIIGAVKGADIPAGLFLLYAGLLVCSALAFLGVGFFISSWVRSQELAVGAAFFVWLFLIAFIDIALIGFMIKSMMPENVIFAAAMLNPVQVFRIGAICLFDPVLSVTGPASYFILDTLGRSGCAVYSLVYPAVLGVIFAVMGYVFFKKSDLV